MRRADRTGGSCLHGMERTHEEGLYNTFELIKGFIGADGETK